MMHRTLRRVVLVCIRAVLPVGLAACGGSATPSAADPATNGTEVSVDVEPATETAALGEVVNDEPALRGELVLEEVIDIPVREASGVTMTRRDGAPVVNVVGDKTAELTAGTYSQSDGFSGWESSDLGDLPDWEIDDDDSQFEAIARAGDGLLAIMTEDPPVVTVGDPATGLLTSRIELVVGDDSQLHWDEKGSRGEGLVLLRDGRMLVAKEKEPSALIVFGPDGAPARLTADDLLEADQPWEAPSGDNEFVALAAWRLTGDAANLLEDVSGLAAGADGSLWLLSDQSQRLGRLDLARPLPAGEELGGLDEAFDLPHLDGKPEGVTVLGNDRFLIVLDRPSDENNGLIVAFPT